MGTFSGWPYPDRGTDPSQLLIRPNGMSFGENVPPDSFASQLIAFFPLEVHSLDTDISCDEKKHDREISTRKTSILRERRFAIRRRL